MPAVGRMPTAGIRACERCAFLRQLQIELARSQEDAALGAKHAGASGSAVGVRR
jgi:hypothetical protein